jgi:hypothetical protein
VALPGMQKAGPIVRENVDDEAFHIFYYPYNGFPRLVSHIHPKFAIFEAGRKLKELENVFIFSRTV